jgi:MFS family permease
MGMKESSLSRDARLVLAAQAFRAFGYGFAAVLLGVVLADRHLSSFEVGLVVTSVIAGTAIASVFIARYADDIGRRRCYIGLYLLLAATGITFAFVHQIWALVGVALLGALSTEVVESGPFTSLEQAMLATELSGRERTRGFGIYNAVATAAGALGALAVGLPELARSLWSNAPSDAAWFLVLVPAALAGAAIAASLSAAVEAPERAPGVGRSRLTKSRRTVFRLSGLFALDSFGGGFVVQAFLAYWFTEKYNASVATVGFIFFGVALIQTGSFLIAPRLAERFGLLHTMVFTHLPSNVFLMLIPFAPTFPIAVVFLFARTALSQMDVPTRQAYVMALVEPDERTPAAAYTNTARYLTRPLGAMLAGAVQSFGLGAPLVIAGTIKSIYDLALWRWFSQVKIPEEEATEAGS